MSDQGLETNTVLGGARVVDFVFQKQDAARVVKARGLQKIPMQQNAICCEMPMTIPIHFCSLDLAAEIMQCPGRHEGTDRMCQASSPVRAGKVSPGEDEAGDIRGKALRGKLKHRA